MLPSFPSISSWTARITWLPHAGISSDDEVYKALDELVTKNGYRDAVAKLGRGKGSNLVLSSLLTETSSLAKLSIALPSNTSWIISSQAHFPSRQK